MTQQPIDENRRELNGKFFSAMEKLRVQTFIQLDKARRQFSSEHRDLKHCDLNVRYTLKSGMTWEPFYDKKHKVSGWRPIRRHGFSDLLHQWKHGHDHDFVQNLPEIGLAPGYLTSDLWAWKQDLRPFTHVLMLQQELQKVVAFCLLVYANRQSIEDGKTFVENRDSLDQCRALDPYYSDFSWQDLCHIHGEVMRLINT